MEAISIIIVSRLTNPFAVLFLMIFFIVFDRNVYILLKYKGPISADDTVP